MIGGSIIKKIRVARSIGLLNIARVVSYRAGLISGLNSVLRLRDSVPVEPFFRPFDCPEKTLEPTDRWQNDMLLFGYLKMPFTGSHPAWHVNPLTGRAFADTSRNWWQIPDFDPEAGDIKTVWELSRFDWVLAFAERMRNGDTRSATRLNRWLGSWCESNPPYSGPNWKCGQEASIRIMHLAIAARLLAQTSDPLPGLVDLVRVHLRRIAPTVSYSLAQDNNHGTSEAAALFIGGSWLVSLGVSGADSWERRGRALLENRVRRLIGSDGSFSQYSVNYHRLMLDTLSVVEVWRKHMGLPEFSSVFNTRAAAAARWLFAFVDPVSGDAPNIGANDGARLIPLTSSDYRDFRPSVQLSMALFTGMSAYDVDGSWNDQLAWLGIDLPGKQAEPIGNLLFDDGGYAVLRKQTAMAVMRYPRFFFRPSHADALHVDLWRNGENLLRDSGTFSYHTDLEWLSYFPGTSSHNTVQFDDRDQMPRIGRFIFGDWLKTERVESILVDGELCRCGAAYRDASGARHRRTMTLTDRGLIVCDDLSGFRQKAVLRWRLRPGEWTIDGQEVTDGKHRIVFSSEGEGLRIALRTGWESRYYYQKTALPILELEIQRPGSLTTEYYW